MRLELNWDEKSGNYNIILDGYVLTENITCLEIRDRNTRVFFEPCCEISIEPRAKITLKNMEPE